MRNPLNPVLLVCSPFLQGKGENSGRERQSSDAQQLFTRGPPPIMADWFLNMVWGKATPTHGQPLQEACTARQCISLPMYMYSKVIHLPPYVCTARQCIFLPMYVQQGNTSPSLCMYSKVIHLPPDVCTARQCISLPMYVQQGNASPSLCMYSKVMHLPPYVCTAR